MSWGATCRRGGRHLGITDHGFDLGGGFAGRLGQPFGFLDDSSSSSGSISTALSLVSRPQDGQGVTCLLTEWWRPASSSATISSSTT